MSWYYAGGPTVLVAKTAVFDGTNDYMRQSAVPTGIADGKAFTLSFWVKFAANGTQLGICAFSTSTTVRFQVRRETSNKIGFYAYTSAGGVVLSLISASTFTAADGWSHVFLAINVNGADVNLRHLYKNGVEETATATWTTFSDATIDFDVSPTPRYTIGGNASDPAGIKLNGSLCEFWFDDSYFNDVTKFYYAGKPLALGVNGQPSGGPVPVYYFSTNGDGDSWAVDSSGNGNDMTVTGALGTTAPP